MKVKMKNEETQMKPETKIDEVWIVINSEYYDENSILGVFTNDIDAKIFIADYVLANDIETGYLMLTNKPLKGSKENHHDK